MNGYVGKWILSPICNWKEFEEITCFMKKHLPNPRSFSAVRSMTTSENVANK